MSIQDIKTRLSIMYLAKHYGLERKKNDMVLCPFHDDKTPSLKLYRQTNTFNCFGCGANGDVIELIQLKENLTKREAIEKAKTLAGLSDIKILPTPTTPTKEMNELMRVSLLMKYLQSCKSSIARHNASKEYCQSRNLNYQRLKIGYSSQAIYTKWNKELKGNLIELGVLMNHPMGYANRFRNCITFELQNKEDKPIGIYGRYIDPASEKKHVYLPGKHQGLYPCYPDAETTKLILTESVIDAATLYQLPEITQEYEILALYGTNGLTEEHQTAIKELKKLDEIIFFFDGDKAGEQAVNKYEESFRKLKPNVNLSNVVTPENEDINSLLTGHEPEVLTHLLKERTPLTEKKEEADVKAHGCASQSIQSDPKNNPAMAGNLNTHNPDYITFESEDLLITILGGINLQQLDRLRITIKINRTDSRNPLHSIRHTIDLYHSDYLEKFINKACEQLETGTNTIRRAIAELTDQLEQYRLSKIESQKQKEPQQRQLSEQQERKAIKYLSSPKLMERTNQDIGRTGMIGEENNRLLMYLVFTSRLREQPLHIISLGASGTGKTYLQEKISELIPQQDKLEITILSENAFYYFDKKELKNKLVLIEDMDGAENVLYPLRELQSKKRISKTIPIKDSKGNLKTITLQVEGPICLAGTTTKEKLYEDNANRSLLIYLDNSHHQKERIMEYQRKLSAGRIKKQEENQMKEFFKDMQTVLKPIKVRNPYAEYLKIPEYVFKPLRTNAHYLAVIETITFYHQYQRELKTDGETGERYIETTLEDIEWANKLLKDVLLAKSDELSGECRRFFENLKSWLKTTNQESFYKKDVREAFRMNPNNLKYYLVQLQKYNYIKVIGGNRHKSGYEYEILNKEEYKELNKNLTTALDAALNEVKIKMVGNIDNKRIISTVTHSTC